MGQSFQDLLDEFHHIRSQQYRSEPDRLDAILECMETTMQTILEKLRDLHDVR